MILELAKALFAVSLRTLSTLYSATIKPSKFDITFGACFAFIVGRGDALTLKQTD
jgi:hypothetical protein